MVISTTESRLSASFPNRMPIETEVMRFYLEVTTNWKKSWWVNFVEEGPKTSEVCETMLVKNSNKHPPSSNSMRHLRDWCSNDGLFLHLEDPQESTRINTTQPTPHQSQSHWWVEATWRIKGSTTQKQQQRAIGSQEAHCSWSRRLKTQQRWGVAMSTKASTRMSKE